MYGTSKLKNDQLSKSIDWKIFKKSVNSEQHTDNDDGDNNNNNVARIVKIYKFSITVGLKRRLFS